MRLPLALTAALLASGCTMGNQKVPNPEWKPKVETVALDPQPADFVTGDFRFRIRRLEELDVTKYGLVRQVVGRWLYYDLEFQVSDASSPENDVYWNDLTKVEFRLLDADDNELQHDRRPQLRKDHPKSQGGADYVHVRIECQGRYPDRQPAYLVIGEQRIPLRR
ncbi:MAG: hypothetical protein AAF682_00255 [Planctomycetota bacterium]